MDGVVHSNETTGLVSTSANATTSRDARRDEAYDASGHAPRAARWGGPRMHHLLFLALTVVVAAPLAVLAIWEGSTAFQNELVSVRERHTLVARNLTSTMSRYVMDMKSAFSLAFTDGALSRIDSGLGNLMLSLNVTHICILNAEGGVEAVFPGLVDDKLKQRPDLERFQALRALADEKPNEPVLSNLYHDASGRPVFYLLKALPRGRLGLGVVSTSYLVSLQRSIAFGDRGHAVITDARGQVIAHPLKDWVTASRDISGVPVVAAMMRGETGVGQFFSPAFDDTMIAGYAVVPETGWGVMVPQPITELRRRASQINQFAIIIAGASFFAAALMSYLLALWLARPVRRVAATAEEVMAGNDLVSVPAFGRWAPSEVRSLGLAFNTMLEDLRRKAAETLQALHQAETSSKAKTQFLANMSHELRTPLNGVVGMLELLRLSGVSSTQQSYLDQANKSSHALLRMLNDVLDLSEMEVGAISLRTEPFRLDAMLETLRGQYAEQVEEKRLSLAVTVPDALSLTLLGDEGRVARLLGNLIGNAIKFTHSGGVAIQVSAVSDFPTAMEVRFDVGDTGIGIPPEMQQRIFEAFTQGDASMTRRHGGSGLGLAIVKELAERMNGRFGVHSIVGVGSTFWVSLPFRKSLIALEWKKPAPAERTPRAEAASPFPAPAVPSRPSTPRHVSAAGRALRDTLRAAGRDTLRVLLVEDNSANLRVTKALLETLDCEVTTAINGIEAVAAYKASRYDLVLMDCQMPEMDGYQATRVLRQIEMAEGRFTPVLALTAHAMDGSRELCLAAGMNDQLSKPLTLAALTAKLREWLIRERPAA